MDAMSRIERTLAGSLGAGPRRQAARRDWPRPCTMPCSRAARASGRGWPRGRHACGDDDPALADAAAAAIELLHCASLVHDDLPCFDDAGTRRGKPSVHRAFGEQLAVLAGDALIVLAFQAIARAATASPERLPALLLIVGNSVGVPNGIVAGPGLGVRAAGRPGRVPAGQDRRAVRRRDDGGRGGARRRGRPVAQPGRASGRGLPGRRRPARRRLRRRGAGQAGRAG